MTRHDAKCPVTAQRVRDIAGVVDECDAGDLLALADWLQTYDPKQLGEVMELLPDLRPQQYTKQLTVEIERRKRALLAKWNGGTTDASKI